MTFLNKCLVAYITVFLSGCLYALGFPQKEIYTNMLFSHLGVGLLFYTEARFSTLKKKALLLLTYSLGYNLVGYYWIPETLREFGDIAFPLNYILGTVFSFIILPHYFLFLLYTWNTRNRSRVLSSPVVLAFIMTLLEYYVPQQFPAHLGHTWLQLAPYVSLTPFFGANVYSFASYFFIFSLLEFVHTKHRNHLALSTLTLASFLIYGFISPLILQNKQSFMIRMVQANIGNMLKLNSEKGYREAEKVVYKRYSKHSLKDLHPDIRLIIWPETALPDLLMTRLLKQSPDLIPDVIKEVTNSSGAYLFTGGYDRADAKSGGFFETQYNSGMYFSPQGEFIDVYHKSKLIPFGESLPFGRFNKYLANLNPNIAFFATGTRRPVFNIDNSFYFSTAICYEVLFSSFIKDYLNSVSKHPQFIVNITNDSWYGDTAEPYQHKHLAHWRSLEFQLPLVRMTNTGISNILYQDGSESDALTHNQEDKIDLLVKVYDNKPTLFQRYGLLPLKLLIMLMFIVSRLLETFTNKVMQTKEP